MSRRSVFQASQRIEQVQNPIIPKVAEWINQNPGTLSMAQGVVNYGPPAKALAELSLQANDTHLNHYGPANGHKSLRQKITDKLKTDNSIEIANLQRIFVTAGANMGFLNALLAITQPGDEVILLAPFYFNHEMAIRMLGCLPVAVSTDLQYQPEVECIAKAITNKTRAIVTVSPNNPTGAVYSPHLLQQINDLCGERGLFHISDEAYEYFHFDNSAHYSPLSKPNAAEHTLALYSFSKSFGVAGWRIAYMVVPEALIQAVSKAQDTNLICANRLSQQLAEKLLGYGKPYCTANQAYLTQNRDVCIKALQEFTQDEAIVIPHGAFYLFMRLDSEKSAEEIVERLIQDFGIAVLPGSTFGMHKGCYLRVSYGALSPEQCAVAVERLHTGLSQMIGQ